jgi:16S rRNA (guanine527-N7)-methyltransferase
VAEDRARARCDERRRRERSPDGPRRHDRQEECLDRSRDLLPTRVDACPALPAAYHERLDAGLRALDLTLDPESRHAIDGHVRLLVAWNAAINLTSIRDPAQMAIRHVVDSLSAVRVLRRHAVGAFLDIGSGGGFPGLPLAAAMPETEALLIDSVGKKARFLGVAIEAVGLGGRLRVGSVRAEALAADPRHRELWPAVTARAVASLAELVELAFPLLLPGGVLVAWKRGDLDAERATADRAIASLGGGSLEVLPPAIEDGSVVDGQDPIGLSEHRLVVVRRGRQAVPAAYPREPAARRRRPW